MKTKLRKILKIITIILLPVSLQVFASSRNKVRVIKEVRVDHQSSDMYITDETVRRMVLNNSHNANQLGLLKLNEIEKLLDNHAMVEKSEVFCTIDGILNVSVKQRQPIARFYENGKFFYMDSQGKKMPLSDSFSARVPLITGNVNEKYWENTYDLIKFIQNDDFLTKNITEIKVKRNGEYEFQMRVASFVVIWGDLEGMEQKKANLKAFYKQMEKSKTLNVYKIVNLKYSNQVVCTK
ncbi:cell division protein FtsQ/DivIB [Capnocytophaga felis]|uniref:Cell division protein FtsQ n=1 Tax=Capnocytophaga felis TaxID=2267611 RepID=A0A5M4BAW0_9FLAO|nr:cell division protein FtsQ/DivIB [Capnocytophaga felis]GET46689.1 cell division protein FtsQ [Capnocytophaga felis]GET48791.1 cell division protein FtsQ [Capnocytophaga felis]